MRAEAALAVRLIVLLPAGHRLAKQKGAEVGLEELSGETIFYKRREHAPCYSQRRAGAFRTGGGGGATPCGPWTA